MRLRSRASPWSLSVTSADVARTLKNSEVDLLKAREELKEMTRARGSAEAGLAGAQKQAED